MQRFATLFVLGLLLAGTAIAQPDRVGQDVMWARDIGSATIAVDGSLDEAVWSQAETYTIAWDGVHPLPGSGQSIRDNPAGLDAPVDPTNATVYFLRKGNELYLGLQAQDASIGGDRGFFVGDGLLMTLLRPLDRPETFTDRDDYFESSAVREEMFYGWQHPSDTTATGDQVPGIAPKAWSTDFGYTAGDMMSATPRSPEAWEFAAVVDGVANDDYNGGSSFVADNGYTFEMRIRLDSLGWDLTQPMSRMPLTMSIMDRDFSWPIDADRFMRHWTWWQGRWFNNFNEGMAFIAGDPSVTVSSGPVPAYTEPEFTVPSGMNTPAPTIDGVLDEPVWSLVEPQFSIKYQATAEELDAGLPGPVAPNYTFYFHPDANPVLDPTEGRFHMYYRENMLYIGLDTDDQAVNGSESENTRDGFRFTIAARDSLKDGLGGSLAGIQFDFSVDSTGTARLGNYAATLAEENPAAIMAGVSMKNGSTPADPSDIDAGYQMEVAIDLTALGFPANLDDEPIYIALNYFDGDSLEDDAQSYGTRTWVIGERNNGASLYGLLSSSALVNTARDRGPESDGLRALGTAPNPATDRTQVRFSLDRTAEVTVEVFDVLGRLVQTIDGGVQIAGDRAITVDTAGLSTGAYVYRVRLADGAAVTGRMMVVR